MNFIHIMQHGESVVNVERRLACRRQGANRRRRLPSGWRTKTSGASSKARFTAPRKPRTSSAHA
ncbi:hypothetical protein FBR01_03845 [Anaerolineae bacterium CFX8]|nr:hypothetical protein [Anaerolineae bacterium CFX8]